VRFGCNFLVRFDSERGRLQQNRILSEILLEIGKIQSAVIERLFDQDQQRAGEAIRGTLLSQQEKINRAQGPVDESVFVR